MDAMLHSHGLVLIRNYIDWLLDLMPLNTHSFLANHKVHNIVARHEPPSIYENFVIEMGKCSGSDVNGGVGGVI